jgi:hypothetical protein
MSYLHIELIIKNSKNYIEMNTKSLLLIGIVGLSLVTIIKTVISRMEIFDEEDEDQELDGQEEDYGFPLFI